VRACWKCDVPVPETYRYCLACGSDTEAADRAGADPMLGRTIVEKFRIEETLGGGAMGTIYRADQIALGKPVVIKLLHPHLLSDTELVQRFQREARAASRLNQPNCVQIIDFGQTEHGALYIAMEYIPGDDLATLLEREYPIDHRRLIHITKQVCLALDEAHANGVLHRDLKPENIMVTSRRNEPDFVKVVDFGIAKLDENNPNSKRSFKTRTGIVCGTPEYMSPEQARGKPLDARSDIYALGVTLYHMVADRLPFDAPSPIEIVTKHLSEDPVPPREYRRDLPETFERLIMTMLAKDREKRPTAVMDVHAELDRIDRELAIARREAVEEPRRDDATRVDFHPSAALQAAIAAVDGEDPHELPTEEAPARDRGAGSARVVPMIRPLGVNVVTGYEDTLPAPDGSGLVAARAVGRDSVGELAPGGAAVESARRKSDPRRKPKPKPKPSRSPEAAAPLPANAHRPERGEPWQDVEAPASASRDAREQITVNTSPVPESMLKTGAPPEGAGAAPSTSAVQSEPTATKTRPRRGPLRAILLVLVIAGALGAGTWAVVTYLQL